MDRLALPVLLVTIFASPVFAGDEKAQTTALPGVDASYSIVSPAPEPTEPPPGSFGTRQVGKWELTVSGYVWVQVGGSSNGR